VLKVLTLVGTRPELIKLSLVIAELDKHVNHVLVHSGQNYDFELNEVFFRDLGIREPDRFLEAAGGPLPRPLRGLSSASTRSWTRRGLTPCLYWVTPTHALG